MSEIRVLVADDHALMREGLTQLIELEEDITVIGHAVNGEDAIEKITSLKPDVVLMDINMHKMNGLQAIKELKERGIKVKIIILTIHTEREYLLETVQHGAMGYVLKDAESEVLMSAIRRVNAGDTYIQPNITSGLLKELQDIKTVGIKEKDDNALTPREIEVLKLISQGLLNKEIAQKLFISEKTVKNHISSIFKKINVNDRTQAAIYAFKNNLTQV